MGWPRVIVVELILPVRGRDRIGDGRGRRAVVVVVVVVVSVFEDDEGVEISISISVVESGIDDLLDLEREELADDFVAVRRDFLGGMVIIIDVKNKYLLPLMSICAKFHFPETYIFIYHTLISDSLIDFTAICIQSAVTLL